MAVEIAQGYVSLALSTGGMGRQLTREFGVVPRAADKAGKESGRKFGSGFGGTVKSFLGAAAIYEGIKTGIGFLAEANAEARESQKVGAATTQIIKSTGGAAKISADQIGALATAISNKTGMDDEAVQTGANLLLTFKNVRNEAGAGAKIFDRATQSAVDLSAAGFGSVSSASKQLGKALNDPIKGTSALARAGVTFTDQQKEQIKTLVQSGDTLGAQKIILGEVESQVGGVAAASSTMGEKLSVAFGNFKEQVGTALLPLLDRFGAFMVNKGIPALSKFATFLATTVPDAVARVREALTPAIGVIGQVVQRVTAAGNSGSFLQTKLVPAAQAVGGAFQRLWAVVGPILSQVYGALRRAFLDSLPTIRAALSTLRDIVTGALGLIRAIIERVTTVIKGIWNRFGGTILSIIRTVFGTIIKVVAAALKVVSGVIKLATALIRGDWKGAWNAVKQIFAGVLGVIKALAKGALGVLRTLFADGLRAIRDRVTGWAQSVKATWNAFWTSVRQKARDGINAIRTKITDTLNSIRTIWSDAQSAVKGSWDTFWNGKSGVITIGKRAIGSVKSAIEGVLGKGKKGGLRQVFSDAVGAITKTWEGLQNKLQAPVNWIIDNVFDKIRSAYNKIAKIVGMDEIPPFAKGGAVDNRRDGANSSGPGRKDGGPIPKRADGGRIYGVGGPRQDNIMGLDRRTGVQTSWVSAGEFVVNEKQYRKNKKLVEAVNAGFDFETPDMRRLAAQNRRNGGLVQRLWLGGGVNPLPGASWKRHTSGYGWARYAGDGNRPGDYGASVKAYKAGVVAAVRTMQGSYGKHIRINHGGERTLYAHLSKFKVRSGQQVQGGQSIGNVGSTGNSTGPHLHFELAGGGSKISNPGSGGGGGFLETVINAIKPRVLFTKAIGKLLDGLANRLPQGNTPFGKLIAALPRKLVAGIKDKLPATFGVVSKAPGGSPGGSPNGNKGLGPRARAARAYVIDRWGITNIGGYANRNIAGTNKKSKHALGKAIDIMTYKRHGEIAGYFATGPGKRRFGVDNVITKRRIHNSRGWHAYRGIPHYNHVHVDFFKNGGRVRKFDRGGMLQPGPNLAINHTKKPEPVLTNKQWRIMSDAARVNREKPAPQPLISGNTFQNIDEDKLAEKVATVLRRRESLQFTGAS